MFSPDPTRVADRFSAVQQAGIVFQEGDVVQVKTRKGPLDGYVVSAIHNYRARRFPYEVKVTTDDGQDFTWKAETNRYDAPRNARVLVYKGRTRKTKPLQKSKERQENRQKKKLERADEGVASLESWKLHPGDVILYRYRDMRKQETVAGVNYRMGKVGVHKFSDEERGRRQTDRDRQEFLDEVYGMGKKKRNTDIRWLPATGIVEVVSRG